MGTHVQTLTVGPPGDLVRSVGIGDEPEPAKVAGDFFSVPGIPLDPVIQVLASGQEIPLVVVAGPMRQHEVVGRILRVSSPGDEMIDLCRAPNAPTAVEAGVPLERSQDLGHRL